MITDCPKCECAVDAKRLFEHDQPYDPDSGDLPLRVVLVQCPKCKSNMLIEEEYFPPADDWSDVGRLWPPTELPLDPSIPHSVSESVEEARKCFRAKAYSACAVMCGRALEDICVEFKTKKLLAGGLQELRDRKIIDITILEWGDALRKHRNLGAHSSGVKITKEDAIDLLDFTLNIVEYVFVLKKKFSDFMDRQKQARAKASAGKSDGENGS